MRSIMQHIMQCLTMQHTTPHIMQHFTGLTTQHTTQYIPPLTMQYIPPLTMQCTPPLTPPQPMRTWPMQQSQCRAQRTT